MKASFLLCSFLPAFVFSFHGNQVETTKRCNRESFQIPQYYVIHIGGYSLLRHCSPGKYYIPRLCRCVSRRLVTISAQNHPRTDPSRMKEDLPRSGPGVGKESNISTVFPGVKNVFAEMGELLNVQLSDSLQSGIMNLDKNSTQQQQRVTNKPSSKSLVTSSLKNKSGKSKSKSQRGKRERAKNKKDKTKVQKSLEKHAENQRHHVAEDKTDSSLKKGIVLTKLDSTRKQNRILLDTKNESFCNPYFRFVFDRTSLSEDKSVPSSPSKSLQFLGVAGSTGKTAAYFDGKAWVTVWGMSYITFAPKFKFQIRFRLSEDYSYKDEFYTLISDGPCEGSKPQYSVSVNPARREIHSFINLKSENELDLLLSKEVITNWVTVTLQGTNSEITLSTKNAKTTGNIGVSSIKSSSCPMEIGKRTPLSQGFVGFIDTVQFHNCF